MYQKLFFIALALPFTLIGMENDQKRFSAEQYERNKLSRKIEERKRKSKASSGNSTPKLTSSSASLHNSNSQIRKIKEIAGDLHSSR